MITPKKIEKRIHTEVKYVKKTAIKEVVKVASLVVGTLVGATIVLGLLTEEDNDPSIENYEFICYGLSGINEGRIVVISLDETRQIREILNDYHWMDQKVEDKGTCFMTNGKDVVWFNDETGQLYNEERGFVLNLNKRHSAVIRKILEK